MKTTKYLLAIWFVSLSSTAHSASIWNYFSGQDIEAPDRKDEVYTDTYDFYSNETDDDEDAAHPNSSILYDYLQKGVKGVNSWLGGDVDEHLPVAEPVEIHAVNVTPINDDIEVAEEIKYDDYEKPELIMEQADPDFTEIYQDKNEGYFVSDDLEDSILKQKARERLEKEQSLTKSGITRAKYRQNLIKMAGRENPLLNKRRPLKRPSVAQ